MIRTVVTRVTALLAASLALVAPALAGDRAEFRAIGYSEDGRYLAFEEYGVQDGSGFPFSTIYIIDLPADGWAKGTPVRVLLESEEQGVADARKAAADKVRPTLDALKITGDAVLIALNGDGEPDAAGDTLAFGAPSYGMTPVQEPHTLALESFELPATPDCAPLDMPNFGFALTLDGAELVRDVAPLPKSRGCPLGYKIYGVVGPAEWTFTPAPMVAIVSNYPFGFEGPDRRFLAVPLGN